MTQRMLARPESLRPIDMRDNAPTEQRRATKRLLS